MKTEQQLKNLREALVWWQTVPEENVAKRLNTWTLGQQENKRAATCNTVACFGGWACRYPSLVAQGAVINVYGWPAMADGSAEEYEVASILFGDDEMFKWRGKHPADNRFTGSDHALVTNRIRWALEQA